VPRKIVTDQLRSYPAAKAEIVELANVKHVFVKATAWLNSRAENCHQPTRERERRIPQGDFLRGVPHPWMHRLTRTSVCGARGGGTGTASSARLGDPDQRDDDDHDDG
jgi:hypothetical protein